MQPKVSVIIPFYNLGDYVEESINSVLNQTYKDWEIIIVDDGSTDAKSLEVLYSIEKRNLPNLQIFHKENQGLARTRNYGIERSKGEYICCLDSDDVYHEDFLSETVELLNSNVHLGFVTTWVQPFELIDGEKTIVQVEKDSNAMLVRNVPHVASLFKKSAWLKVGGYDPNGAYAYEDWNFWLSILEYGYDWDVIPKALFFYRIRGSSMLRTMKVRDEQNYEYLLSHHKELVSRMDFISVLKSARKTIFEYDQIIFNLNKENKSLNEKLDALKNSRLYKFYSIYKNILNK